ncbi:alpha/beta fold hydrolase [Candidatus Planktophila dulcis]|uniref:alpha/beta fold hydrolase n=1 Tax=Candidatus Planktophila dulcis TaxID=1884914 RepID=UPI003CECB483
MKITSVKSRAIALLSTTALLATIVVASPAQAAAVGPTCDAKTPIQTCVGTTSDGAAYEIRVPSSFNGTVAIWSHGLGVSWPVSAGLLPPFPNGIPVDPRANVAPYTVVGSTSSALASSILADGVAVMGSGFPVQGWNLDEAVKTNVELIGIFKKAFPTTKKVVAWGYSAGGGITQALAEQHPEIVDAVAIIDPVAPAPAMQKLLMDALWLFKTYFDPSMKLTGYSAGKAGDLEATADIGKMYSILASVGANMSTGKWPATAGPSGKALEAAGVPVRSAMLLCALLVGLPVQSASYDNINGPDGALKLTFPLAVSPALAALENFGVALTSGLSMAREWDTKFGPNWYDNTKTNFATQLSESDRDIYNAALSGNTVIDALLSVLNPANPAAPRLVGEASAVAKAAGMYSTTGKITVPTIMMTGTNDPVPAASWIQQVSDKYAVQFAADKAAAMAAAKKSRVYVAPKNKLSVFWLKPPKNWTKFDAAGSPIAQSYVAGNGHALFTQKQFKFMIDSAIKAANTGVVPSGGPSTTAARKAGLVKDKYSAYPYLKYYN